MVIVISPFFILAAAIDLFTAAADTGGSARWRGTGFVERLVAVRVSSFSLSEDESLLVVEDGEEESDELSESEEELDEEVEEEELDCESTRAAAFALVRSFFSFFLVGSFSNVRGQALNGCQLFSFALRHLDHLASYPEKGGKA